MEVLIIIPAFNEEDSLEHTVFELQEFVREKSGYKYDFIVVNDGSSDSTAEVCRENAYPMLSLPVNTGLSSAFQTGMKYAVSHGYDYVIQFDADGQHDPQYLDQMVSAALKEKADIVIGSRFIEKKKHRSMRMLGSFFIVGMIRLTSGRKVTDPTSGMRLFGKNLIERFARDNNYAPEPDTIAFAIRNGSKVVEVPVAMRERYAGQSYLSAAKSIIYMIRMGLSILFFQWIRKA